MRYRLLGKSGLRVSELCLGAMTFGEEWGWGASKAESRRIFDLYVEAGGNFIDTADVYTNGTSELYVGEFIADNREKFVVSTKYNSSQPVSDPNAAGNHRKKMIHSLEASLKRLNVDYIDVYWVHVWDVMTPIEEVIRALDDMVRAGKILYIAISDVPAWIVSRANTIAELRGWTEFIGLQIQYNLLQRTPERELLPMAKALDIGVLAWAPLANGILTGKYVNSPDSTQDMRLKIHKTVPANDHQLSIVREVCQVAGELGCSPAQVALNWLRHQSGVIPIIGARTLGQLKENLASLDFTLPLDQLERLNNISRIDMGFPHDFLISDYIRNLAYGGMFDRIDNHRA